MKLGRAGLVLLVMLLLVLAWHFDLSSYLDLEFLRQKRDSWSALISQYPLRSSIIFFLGYVLATALSVPGATLLTLFAGTMFGLLWGTVLVSFASTVGAVLAMLVARYLARDWISHHCERQMAVINKGIQRDGVFYLFGLRMVPVFPFFLINLLMGLTSMRVWTFAWVSQIGMLLGTVAYVYTGARLTELNTPADVLSLPLLSALAVVGLLPLLTRWSLSWLRDYRHRRQWPKPAHYDYNLVVIGAGAAGLVTSYIAAAVRARVALVEKAGMGGDCLHTGCVPSKALLRAAHYVAATTEARNLGLRSAQVEFDFAEVMERVQQTIQQVAPHDGVERYTTLGVDCIAGEARLLSPWQLQVGDRQLTSRNIVIATGARPALPPIPGLTEMDPLTSETFWQLRELPQRLLILGGGAVGCELGQAMACFGSEVMIVERAGRLLPREDEEVAVALQSRCRDLGISLHLAAEITHFSEEQGTRRAWLRQHGTSEDTVSLEFDRVLVASGRQANTEGMGLEALGIERNADGTLQVDDFLRTRFRHIFACGDVAGPYQYTHAAAHQAWYASVNALFGLVKRYRVDYRHLPMAVFTDPQIARVGLTEQQARLQGVAFEVSRFDLGELDRAIIEGRRHGWIKVLTATGKDRILGVTIVGDQAAELMAEFVLAMKHNIGLNKVLSTIHIYPTLAEANKYVAGVWKRQHTPQWILPWLERYHTWRRGQ
ncbi:pyridine nucleotide-disulfide oxidoreductase [Pokkaliibacter plantistimulans]|uniref:Pyridine nucleotide-disulfide oxidoreductase n=1 Tax=Pokkaliibacter plantistimulans TaxID=1635171 RepID=A0ABX5LTP4_9GAMM|nr:bifunctional TVP38/TMEM64 family protein/FAD-dependent oxidoreductase [Pokkaliibacter plantistimulans]PXF28883.1 pyridine nucleotide-disulfide oxidoreductase [Pokkaliibacter plantistimulans]